MSKRNPKTLGVWGNNGTRVPASESYWRQPYKWNREAAEAGERRRVFCASLADVFEDRPELEPWRERLWEIISDTPDLDWLLLTKRPENVRKMVPEVWVAPSGYDRCTYWPLNTWLGTSVENQETADERIPHLLACPAAVRFVSYEPALGPVRFGAWLPPDYTPYGMESGNVYLDWVIAGGESGHNARPCHIEWIRDVVDQCKAARVPCFVKQMGSKPYAMANNVPAVRSWGEAEIVPNGDFVQIHLKDPKGGDPAEWPEDLRVREMP